MRPYPDLVVFLPGIGGSTLLRDGRTIWGGTWRAMANAVAWGGLAKLVLAVGDGGDDAGDGVEVGAVIDDLHVVPGLWKIDA